MTNLQNESVLRRTLAKQGYTLHKRGDGYMVIDTASNAVVSGSDPIEYSASLGDVEAFIRQYAS